MKFTHQDKDILNYFFTSSNESDTVYVAKDTLPTLIISYIMGRTSRTAKTFREIFLELWKEEVGEDSEFIPMSMLQGIHDMKIHAEAFLNKWKLHGSLSDSPQIAVFCDKISILQTKVWEHERVAAYQERSTRYKKFDATDMCMPDVPQETLDKIIHQSSQLNILYEDIMNYRNKRDVARYLVPVGSFTAMASITSVRSWERVVGRMFNYPTRESFSMAENITDQIRKVLPTFTHCDMDDNYFYLNDCKHYIQIGERQKAEIKKWGEVIKIKGLIDIGAHRDLQRHRSAIHNHHDYRAVYGYDTTVLKGDEHLNESLKNQYINLMQISHALFRECEDHVKDTQQYGESQYVTLLGHMTPFTMLMDEPTWNYIYKLRTGHPSQKATTANAVHFSYAGWCKKVQIQLEKNAYLEGLYAQR